MKYITIVIKLIILILAYPLALTGAVVVATRRWFRNLSWGEVSEVNRHWKLVYKEVMHSGHTLWRHRKLMASYTNETFDEKEP